MSVKLALQKLKKYRGRALRTDELIRLQKQVIIDEFCTMKVGDVVESNIFPFVNEEFNICSISFVERPGEIKYFEAAGWVLKKDRNLTTYRGRRQESLPDD